MDKLKPCPFCGGKSELNFQPIYMDKGVCVSCTKCKARSRFVLYNCVYTYYHGQKNVNVTKEQAIEEVSDLWNRRDDNAVD